MKKKIFIFCSLSVFLFCAAVFAQTLYLKNGSKVKGKIVAQDDEKVVLGIGEGEDATEVTIFSDEIERIEEREVSTSEVATEELPAAENKKAKEYFITTSQPVVSLQPAAVEKEQAPPSEGQAESVQAEKKEKIKAEIIAQPQVEMQVGTATTQIETQLQGQAKANLPAGSPQGVRLSAEPSEAVGKVGQANAMAKEQEILEGLTQLLDKEELEYFTKINSMAKETAAKAMQIFADPASSTQDETQLPKIMQDLSLDIAGIITQLNGIKAPPLFANFHDYYLGNLNLLKEMLMNMANGNMAVSQAKIEELQNTNIKIKEELSRILEEKKKNVQEDTGEDVSN